MSLTNLAFLENSALYARTKGIETAVYNYVTASDASATTFYAPMKTAATAILAYMVENKTDTMLPRVTIMGADGVVFYDSSKTTAGANNSDLNSHANANELKGTNTIINTNHNTRLAVITAGLSSSGIGMEKKYSSSTNRLEEYYAQRIGVTPVLAIGTVRYSC